MKTMTNTNTIDSNGIFQRETSSTGDSSLFNSVLEMLYRWQDKGKTPLGHSTPSFKDISATRGDGQTDFAKPVWYR